MTRNLALAVVALVILLTKPLLCGALRKSGEVRPVLRPRRLDKSECLYEVIPDDDGVDRHYVDLKLRFVDGWQEACTAMGIAPVLFHCMDVTGTDATLTGRLKDPDGCKLRLNVGHVSCVKEAFKCYEGYLPDCVRFCRFSLTSVTYRCYYGGTS